MIRLHEHAAEFARVALANVHREFPNDIRALMSAPGDFPNRPKDRHPAFYGSFDWHSCVEMVWTLVRLLRTAPDHVPQQEIRAALDGLLTAENLATEAEYFAAHRGAQRPYGMGWALALTQEAASWGDEDGQRWADNLEPLADVLAGNLLEWLPKATYPVRHGVHTNSAFGLSRSLLYAVDHDEDLLFAITDAAHRWFYEDTDYPAHYEPCGADFLSPALTEAELMAQLLPQEDFADWLSRFLPEPRFTPAIVSDAADGQIAHLHGLNLSRAYCLRRMAAALPGDVAPLLDMAEQHAEAALPFVSGSDYMVEHWLVAYAVLYLG